MKKIKLLTIIGLLMAMLTACGGSSALVGRWEAENASFDIEFFGDSTYKSSDPNYYGYYSVTDDRIRLGGVLMPDMTFTYKVKGDTLYFYDNDGDISQEFRRVD